MKVQYWGLTGLQLYVLLSIAGNQCSAETHFYHTFGVLGLGELPCLLTLSSGSIVKGIEKKNFSLKILKNKNKLSMKYSEDL